MRPRSCRRRLMPASASLALWCMLGSCQVPLCEAGVEYFSISETGHHRHWLVQDIGLDPGARVDIEVKPDISMGIPQNMWLFLFTIDQYFEWNYGQIFELQDEDGVPRVMSSYLTTAWRAPVSGELQTSFEITGPGKARYFLCLFTGARTDVVLSGSMSFVNPGGNQLALQEVFLPPVLFGTAWLFFISAALFVTWLYLAKKWGFLRHSSYHLLGLLGSCLFVKGLVLFLWWADYQYVKDDGRSNIVLSVLWKALDKVYDILELMMFLLIALGWKLLRTALSSSEIRFATFVCSLSMFLGLSEVMCSSAAVCSTYELSRSLLHSLVYLIVICAMNLNLQRVNSQIQEGPASVETGKVYNKIQAYKAFRLIFLVVIVAPTVEMSIQVWFAPWDAAWLIVLITELRTWGMCMAIIIFFALLPDAPTLRIFHDLTRDLDDANQEDGAWAD